MKPLLSMKFNMDPLKKANEDLYASASSSSGAPPNPSTATELTSSNDVTAAAGDRSRRPEVSREEVANAAAQLRHLLRKQTLAYQSHIMDVVRSGDVSELKRFLEQKEGKLNVNFFDKEGQTALHQSCMEGNMELVKVLVKYGADTRLANRDGWNPLHVATFNGHKDIVMFLVNLHSR